MTNSLNLAFSAVGKQLLEAVALEMGNGTDRGGMPVMSGIQILLGQWLLLACSLSGEAGIATCVRGAVWKSRGSKGTSKVGSLSLTLQHSQAGPRLLLSRSCS